MDEDVLNLEIRKFLKEVGITSQREIEKVVRSGMVRGNVLKLRMTLSSETAPLNHVVDGTISVGAS
jgi:16S rRNA U516 pseudouridylate synthase RsuA-like enzyme